MNYERIVILILLLLLAAALFRPQPIVTVTAPKPEAVPEAAASPAETSGLPDVLTVIHRRKSVRTYTGEPVGLPELRELVRAGFAAPTAGNARPWAFVIVTERARLDALADAMPYGKMLKKAPAAIAVCGVESAFRSGESREMWVQDCSAATENILLAAEGTGLGAVWLGVYPYKDRSASISSILKLPEGLVPFSLISVGHPTGTEKPKQKYDPSRLFLQQWGMPFRP
ncbi:nitroreductase family protein [Victivallis vadensis]|uniref:nitroreductase family protein n=1 Tax=Victivallis vadensis TaxID=172901 RepID=UPI003AF6C681